MSATTTTTHWGKLYGSLFLHPKWAATPSDGRALWTSALSYCIVIGSDGDVPESVVPMLNAPGADAVTSVQQLLDSGLWVRTDSGYRFHDWEVHQRTVEERRSLRAKRSEAGKASAEARQRAKSQADDNKGSTSVAAPVEQTPNTVPTEKRREEKRREEQPSSADELFNRFWKPYPKKVSKIAARKAWDRLIKKVDPEVIIRGSEQYAQYVKAERTERKYIKDPDGWLNAGKWEDEIELTTITPRFDPWSKEAYSA